MWIDIVVVACLIIGCFFFLAGTIGLLRFPDIYTRLHALTKAENVGLGFILFGFMVESGEPTAIIKLGIIWLLIQLAGASVAQLIGYTAKQRGVPIWKR